ncbi:hypothetical protein C8F01DRAFT_1286659 [Mycena amicta]|nr:hypothetical protein C8F01DRAFT_1286659 [Mycena amicta]
MDGCTAPRTGEDGRPSVLPEAGPVELIPARLKAVSRKESEGWERLGNGRPDDMVDGRESVTTQSRNTSAQPDHFWHSLALALPSTLAHADGIYSEPVPPSSDPTSGAFAPPTSHSWRLPAALQDTPLSDGVYREDACTHLASSSGREQDRTLSNRKKRDNARPSFVVRPIDISSIHHPASSLREIVCLLQAPFPYTAIPARMGSITYRLRWVLGTLSRGVGLMMEGGLTFLDRRTSETLINTPRSAHLPFAQIPTPMQASQIVSCKRTMPPICWIAANLFITNFQGNVLDRAGSVNPVISYPMNSPATLNQQWDPIPVSQDPNFQVIFIQPATSARDTVYLTYGGAPTNASALFTQATASQFSSNFQLECTSATSAALILANQGLALTAWPAESGSIIAPVTYETYTGRPEQIWTFQRVD